MGSSMAGIVRSLEPECVHKHEQSRQGKLRPVVLAFHSSRIIRACVLGFLAGVTTGCYVYTPVASPPVPGQQLLLSLNDQGRVGLGPSIGSASAQVEGVLQPGMDSAYSLKVVSVSYLNGQRNKWSDEPLVVSRSFVR